MFASRFSICGFRFFSRFGVQHLGLVAEWTHFALFGIILPTLKINVYTFWGL